MIRQLTRAHASIYETPVLDRADDAIFTHRYFAQCMGCTFCADACCKFGVDVDEPNVKRILARADAIEREIGVPRAAWFEADFKVDPEFPGGRHTRTRVVDGYCVFRVKGGRGCSLHVRDYHEIKPLVSTLFPLTFDDGLLHASNEIEDGTLVCGGSGETLYRGVRSELGWYFGEALVAELDALERAM